MEEWGVIVDIVDSSRGPFWIPASECWIGMVWFAMPLCGNAHDGLADQIDELRLHLRKVNLVVEYIPLFPAKLECQPLGSTRGWN